MERNCKNCKNQDCYWVGMDDDDICDEFLPKTNADRIRAMTDEEMAELLRDYQCNTCDFSGFCEETDKCKEEIFKWLTQEVQQ